MRLQVATGYFSVDGLNYFANDSGEIAVRQWLTAEDGTTVFAGVDGAFCGKLDNGVLYIPNADGVLEPASGFVELGGCMFYIDPETHAPSLGWKQFDGAWYYFDENGCAHTGWLDDNGPWYYLAIVVSCRLAGSMSMVPGTMRTILAAWKPAGSTMAALGTTSARAVAPCRPVGSM